LALMVAPEIIGGFGSIPILATMDIRRFIKVSAIAEEMGITKKNLGVPFVDNLSAERKAAMFAILKALGERLIAAAEKKEIF